ncbi:GNAT family N-acetyltransferase [Pedobacter antarcticus]|uniref:GNAT family N-acetyltransferase n=1 Tax=Pedobacter antarcticus TaxID=34086 RepID=UPI001C573182|nr:GNAT family N-acetyltransferase [Pedobacter antarcticus]
MKIINSTAADLEEIFNLYDSGTEYQKKVAEKHWIGFDSEMVLHEIEAKQQWKLMNGTQIAGIFCTTFDDPEIWQEKNADPAVYLHRIVTHPDYRGKNLIQQIISWAKDHAFTHHKKYIRMDTGSGNDKLNNYYISQGFDYLGITTIPLTAKLPAHYKGASSSLFEIALDQIR